MAWACVQFGTTEDLVGSLTEGCLSLQVEAVKVKFLPLVYTKDLVCVLGPHQGAELQLHCSCACAHICGPDLAPHLLFWLSDLTLDLLQCNGLAWQSLTCAYTGCLQQITLPCKSIFLA